MIREEKDQQIKIKNSSFFVDKARILKNSHRLKMDFIA